MGSRRFKYGVPSKSISVFEAVAQDLAENGSKSQYASNRLQPPAQVSGTTSVENAELVKEVAETMSEIIMTTNEIALELATNEELQRENTPLIQKVKELVSLEKKLLELQKRMRVRQSA